MLGWAESETLAAELKCLVAGCDCSNVLTVLDRADVYGIDEVREILGVVCAKFTCGVTPGAPIPGMPTPIPGSTCPTGNCGGAPVPGGGGSPAPAAGQPNTSWVCAESVGTLMKGLATVSALSGVGIPSAAGLVGIYELWKKYCAGQLSWAEFKPYICKGISMADSLGITYVSPVLGMINKTLCSDPVAEDWMATIVANASMPLSTLGSALKDMAASTTGAGALSGFTSVAVSALQAMGMSSPSYSTDPLINGVIVWLSHANEMGTIQDVLGQVMATLGMPMLNGPAKPGTITPNNGVVFSETELEQMTAGLIGALMRA